MASYDEEYQRWYKHAYEQRYGKGSWEERNSKEIYEGFKQYESPFKLYWNRELAVGVM